MISMYNKKVKSQAFMVGDLVLKRDDVTRGVAKAGKLGSNWIRPFIISKVIHLGSYKLVETNERILP